MLFNLDGSPTVQSLKAVAYEDDKTPCGATLIASLESIFES